MTLPSWLGGTIIWKAATGAAVLGIMILSVMLLSANRERDDLMRQRDELTIQINDPQVGLIARLQQQRQNTETLRAGLERQIVVLREKAAQDAAVLEQTRRNLVAANSRAADLERRAQRFILNPPEGDNLEERVLDIDNRIVKELGNGQ